MHKKAAFVLVALSVILAGPILHAADDKLDDLIKGLDDQDGKTRAKAAISLAQLGARAKSAVPALAKALSDRDLNVRYWTANALKAMGPDAETAVMDLVKALETLPGGSPALEGPLRYFADVRSMSAEALGAMGSKASQAVPALKKALSDPDPEVRKAVAAALKRIVPK